MKYSTRPDKPMESVYEDLTGVHIDDQLKSWDARGKGYYGEYLLFKELYSRVPGKCKLLMNLQIPSENNRTTEIDLLLIHETGLFVFEAKHYKGTIYGKIDEDRWTQYFRTTKNNSFRSPIKQNQWHIEQLRKLYPHLPIHSFIVFTSDECRLEVEGQIDNTTLCYQHNVFNALERAILYAKPCFSPDKIDEIFNTLKSYSPIHEATLNNHGEPLGFYDFIEQISKNLFAKENELEQSYREKEKLVQQNYAQKEKLIQRKLVFNKILTTAICCVTVLLCILFSTLLIAQYQTQADDAREELELFTQKWEVITNFEVDSSNLKQDFVVVDHAVLTNSPDLANMVKLSCKLTHNGEEYYVVLNKNTMITVVLSNGNVVEYPYYSSPYYTYSLGYSSSYKTLEIENRELVGFNVEQIELIKLTNLQIKRIKYIYGEAPLLENYEIVLYSAN